MSEIECAQLHNELFRRRHSTRQSHGLFALAKHLFDSQCSIAPFVIVLGKHDLDLDVLGLCSWLITCHLNSVLEIRLLLITLIVSSPVVSNDYLLKVFRAILV